MAMRNDILISIALIDEGDFNETLRRIEAMMDALSQRFQYFEIVCIVSEVLREELNAIGARLARLTNLRIILVSDATRYHQRRLVAASEAIGDVVAIVDPDDFGIDELCDLIEASKDKNEILLGWGRASGIFGYPRKVLTAVTRHNVAREAMRTIVLPRERLNEILNRPSAALDLRYEPSASHFKYRHKPVSRTTRRGSSLPQRYEVLAEILMTGAPRYLKIYAASTFVIASLAIAYAAYAVLVISLRDDVQPGWFSNAIVQSGTVFFMAIGMSVLSFAVAGLIEKLGGGENHAISGEIANIDFFEQQHDLNVELGSSVAEDVSAPQS